MKLVHTLKGIHWPLLFACCSAFAMSMLFSAIKPVMLTRFVEEIGHSQTLASLLVAMPFLGVAAAAPFLGGAIQRLPYTSACWLFGALLMLCELVSSQMVANVVVVMVAQFLSGVSVGALIGITSQRVSCRNNRDAVFGILETLAIFSMSFMVAGVGWAVQTAGLKGGFLFALAVATLLVLVMFLYRPHRDEIDETVQAPKPLVFEWVPVLLIAMGMLFITFSGLGFAYMFTLAKNLGFTYESAGREIGVILFGSALACALGGWFAGRFGHAKALLCAFVACACGWWLACTTTHSTVFLIGLVPAICALQFAFPVLLGLYGSLDKQGLWAAVAAPLLTSGFAWAAIVAGGLVELWGLSVLPYATLGGMLLCSLLLIIAMRAKVSTQAE